MFKRIQEFIDGYKVYILGVAGILGIVVAWASGTMPIWEAIQAIWVILLGMAGRSAVKKIGTLA